LDRRESAAPLKEVGLEMVMPNGEGPADVSRAGLVAMGGMGTVQRGLTEA